MGRGNGISRELAEQRSQGAAEQSLKQKGGTTVFFTERNVYFAFGSRPRLSFSFAGRGMTRNEKRRINYKLRVHSVPQDLQLPLPPDRAHLADAAAAYRIAVQSRLLWDVWMIDQYEALWISISFENELGSPEFHTLRIDPDTCWKVPCDPYETLVERA